MPRPEGPHITGFRPRTPRLNGKVERSHRVDEQEFYQLLDKDGIGDDIHLFNDKLREWEDYYNSPSYCLTSLCH
jgi:transposase InsO family protein